MDHSSITLTIVKPAAFLLLVALAGGEAFALSFAFNQEIGEVWKHITGPLGVLFGELLSIIILAKVLQMIYKQKEAITQKLLDDKDSQIERLNERLDELLGKS